MVLSGRHRAIADIIKLAGMIDPKLEQRLYIGEALVSLFAQDNPLFERKTFLDAANLPPRRR